MSEISQEELDQLKNDLRILKFQQQESNDLLSGGLTSRNIISFRNTYIINASDSLDASFPMYVHFNIINEMIKIVSVKVSFWILNYRAYSKAGASGGGQTSSSGGGQTTSATGSASGGGSTSGASSSGLLSKYIISTYNSVTNVGDELKSGFLPNEMSLVDISLQDHTHTTPNHTHPSHTHTVADHAHTVADHTHDAVYGIFEEETSPTIKFYISENEGVSYNDTFFGGYTIDKSALDITSLITTAGSKLIKFTSDVRARLSVQIEIKLDISAR